MLALYRNFTNFSGPMAHKLCFVGPQPGEDEEKDVEEDVEDAEADVEEMEVEENIK